jgi:hypothetical protein
MVHLLGKERLPFTLIYLSSLGLTLYFAMGLQSAILTPIAACAQVVALVWFVVSYIPGGQTGLRLVVELWCWCDAAALQVHDQVVLWRLQKLCQ